MNPKILFISSSSVSFTFFWGVFSLTFTTFVNDLFVSSLISIVSCLCVDFLKGSTFYSAFSILIVDLLFLSDFSFFFYLLSKLSYSFTDWCLLSFFTIPDFYDWIYNLEFFHSLSRCEFEEKRYLQLMDLKLSWILCFGWLNERPSWFREIPSWRDFYERQLKDFWIWDIFSRCNFSIYFDISFSFYFSEWFA